MSFASNAESYSETVKWLKFPLSIEQDLIHKIGDLDSSKIIFDFSRYNISSRMRLAKISKGIHSDVFNQLFMSHLKAGRYPVLVKEILTGKEHASEKNIRDIAKIIGNDSKLLKDFVVYALVKELETNNEMVKEQSLSPSRAEQLETMIACFDAIYKQLFSVADDQLKAFLMDAIQTDHDIIKLLKIQPRRKEFNAIYFVFGFAALFTVLYSTAFFFIDADASWIAIKKFFGLD